MDPGAEWAKEAFAKDLNCLAACFRKSGVTMVSLDYRDPESV